LQAHLDQLFNLNRGALSEMRNLILQLRPQQWENLTIQEAITQLVNSAKGVSSLKFSITMPDQHFRLSPNTVRNLFYLLKEALNNVAKHAKATGLEIILEQRGKYLVFTVTDDGQGFDPALESMGIGLRTMQERATEIGANFQIKSKPGSGTQITLTLPYSG
jgi:two-component system, NarL family, sensor histidine kinase LiaS